MSEKLHDFWNDKRVFLTGHTGFKGCWLMMWLKMLGAEVFGYSLEPANPSLYRGTISTEDACGVFADIRDAGKLSIELKQCSPQIVFHLAAQPLVSESYKQPALTVETNVMGTVNLLEAVRKTDTVKSVIVITTDKCYKDMNWEWGYRESDSLGGADPYSSSKACVELLCDAWRKSFFAHTDTLLATARAGNVIGGGDWAVDRLVPDAMRAFHRGEILKIRMPNAVRPWQHVLDPLYGYMLLAERLFNGDTSYADAWNFGPSAEDSVNVGNIVQHLCDLWGDGVKYEICDSSDFHESSLLRLDASRAIRQLDWMPRLDFKETLSTTVEWYKRAFNGENPASISNEHIKKYMDRIEDIG
ncbi:CDP-glucose 4,6-dehydratase [Synergistales bacterium]|nr:CDP-glucose 4,6-dehydratase [Synergistales bacterium]